MENIFSHKDQDVGLKAIGYDSIENEDVKLFNEEHLKEYEKIIDEQKSFCFDVFSDEDEVKKIQDKGKMTYLETANKHKLDELVPYWGSGKAGLQSIGIYKNLEKLKKGEILSEKEKEDTKKYIRDMAECELRGRTLGGHVAEGLYSTVPFLFEAGIGLATVGDGVGLLSLGQTASKFSLRKGAQGVAKEGIKDALKNQAKKEAIERAKKLAIDSTWGTAKFTATKTPTEWVRNAGERLVAEDIAISERGEYILNESKSNPAKAVMFALGDTMIENFSETSGVVFGLAGKSIAKSHLGNAVGGCISKNVLDKIPGKFTENFIATAEKVTNLPFTKALSKFGYHGLIEEMGEERIGDLLRVSFNLDGEKGYSFEQYLNALFPGTEQLATEAILFGLIGGGTAGTLALAERGIKNADYRDFAKTVQKATLNEDGTYDYGKMKEMIRVNNPEISEDKLEKVIASIEKGIKKVENYTVDDFLVDAGVIRTPYKESITNERIKEALAKTGLSENDIVDIINYASLEDKSQLIKSFKKDSAAAKRSAEFETDLFNKMTQAGVREDVAYSASKLMGAFAGRFGKNEKKFREWYNKLQVTNKPVGGSVLQQKRLFDVDKHIQEEFGYSVDELTEMIKLDVLNILEENEIDESEFNFEDIRVYGSYSKGKNKDTSDLDFLVQYSGNMREDAAFDMFGEGGLTLTDSKGRVVKVDINPINSEKSGTIEDHLAQFGDFEKDEALYQSDVAKFCGMLVDILSKKGSVTAAQLFNNRPILEPIRAYFKDVLDVNVKIMPDWMIDKGTYGGYVHFNKTIYINVKGIKNFPNAAQFFNRVFLHELMHAKQHHLLDFAYKNRFNLLMSKEDRDLMQKYIESARSSEDNEKEYKKFFAKHKREDIKKSKRLAIKERLLHNKYENAYMEIDADNVALALQYYIGDANSEELKRNLGIVSAAQKVGNKSSNISEIIGIKAFLERREAEYLNSIGRASNVVDTTTFYQAAYHGTPHKFDEFSLEHIGTGEGAQAHGWGLYFAADKKVSEDYRRRLVNDDVSISYDNKIYSIDENFGNALYKIKRYGLDKTIEFFQEKENEFKEQATISQNPDWWNREANNFNELVQQIKNIEENKIEINEGQLYEVDVPENDLLLNEDKSIEEQSEEVKKALLNLWENEIEESRVLDFTAIPVDIIYNGEEIGEGKFVEFALALEIAKKYGKDLAISKLKEEKSKEVDKIVPFDEYIDFVKNVNLDNLEIGNRAKSNIFKFESGEEIYKYLSEKFGSDKEASLKLNEYGIKGIAYDGRQDGKCYVIFDDKAVKVLNTYYQEEGAEEESFDRIADIHKKIRMDKKEAELDYLGYFTEGEDLNILGIMSNSNPSTVIHEMGHLFLNGLREFAKTDEEAREQLEAVNKWLGFNGGEYTRKQQEKFARSFEAYLYKGKAPSNYLRKVFENFKEWLKSIYKDIRNIPGAELSEEVEELFDRIFNGNAYVEEKKAIKELLDKVKSISVGNDSLDETQKRHRDAAYHILSIATGKSPKYLMSVLEAKTNNKGIQKKKENIELALEHVDDKISGGDGFLPEWLELFSQAELYESDYRLAQAAYDAVVSGNYKTTYNEYDFLDDYDAQYTYIMKRFKDSDSDGRNIVLGTFYEWVAGLDSIAQDIYVDKFTADTAYIERRENMDKFERAKEDILKAARDVEVSSKLNTVEGYKQIVMATIKSLDFLQPSDKARLTANILDVSSLTFLEPMIDNILDIAKTMEDVAYRKNLIKQIHAELQTTKNVKKGARTVGKYDYKTNKLFEKLRALDKLSTEKANDMRIANYEFQTEKDGEFEFEKGRSYEDRIVNLFLNYKADGMTYGTTENAKSLYDEIIKIKLAGKNAKSENELFEKLTVEKDIKEVVEILEKKKNSKVLTQGYINWVANWESLLNAIFNKKIKTKFSFLLAETESDIWIYEQKKKFEKELAKIYNLPEWDFDRKILEGLAEKHTFSERVREYDENYELVKETLADKEMNRMEILLAYIWDKNTVLHERLVNQFGEATLEEMFNLLSPQDIKLADYMVKLVNSFYPETNEMFIKKYGLDLPKVSCYFPSTPERAGEADLFNDFTQKTKNDGFTKNRSSSAIIAMEFRNPIEILYSHIDGVGKFIKMTDQVDRANKVFRDKLVKRLVINKYGKDAYRTLLQSLYNVTYKAESKVFSGMEKVFNNVISNWIQGNVIVRPVVGLKQLLSANNYATDMPYMVWQVGFLKALAQPKKTIDYMMKIPYLSARFGGASQNEFLKEVINNSAFARTKKLKDFLSLNIKLGDIGAIIFGGKPYIDYLIKEKGLTEEAAINEFVLSTQRTQQSSAVSSLGNFQVSMGRNPFGKLFTAYKNSPYQYIRMCADAIVSVANGEMTKQQCAKVLFQYAYIQPLFYTLATSGSLIKLLFGGDDEDLKKDLFATMFNLNADAITFIGDAYKFAIEKLIFKEKYMPQATPVLGDLQMEIMMLSKKDVSLEDYLHFAGYGIHLGTGVDANAVANMGGGVLDMFDGNYAKGFLRAIGYTDNRAKHITGQKKKGK